MVAVELLVVLVVMDLEVALLVVMEVLVVIMENLAILAVLLLLLVEVVLVKVDHLDMRSLAHTDWQDLLLVL